MPGYRYYPGWKIVSTGNPAVCTSTDAFANVKQWYWRQLPGAAVAEMEPGENVIVANAEIEVELRLMVGGTSIRFQPREKKPQQRSTDT